MNDYFLNKVPPQNLDAEESILSALMLDETCHENVISILKAEDFYKSSHQKIFSAIQCLISKKEPVDLVTVVEKLRKIGTLEDIGGATFLSQIVDTVPMAANAVYYANIVKEKSLLRSLIEKSNNITEKCFKDTENAFEILDYATKNIGEISSSTIVKKTKSPVDIANNFLDNLEKIKSGAIKGLTTGISRLDLLLGMLQPADFIIIAARPSCGKTSMALTIAKANSFYDKKTLIMSYETTAEKLAARLISSISMVDSSKFRGEGNLSKDEWRRIDSAADQFSSMGIHIDDYGKDDVSGIRRKALKMKNEIGLDLIIVDYLTKMPKPKAERNDLAIAEITGALNDLSNELNIPVILLSQLNRKLEERNNKRPMLSDLRDSGSIEQDADIIIFLYNDSKYNFTNPDPWTEAIVAKARDGDVGMVKMEFKGSTTEFINYSGYDNETY